MSSPSGRTTPSALRNNCADLPTDKSEDTVIVVDWDENEARNPRNWSKSYKCWVALQLWMLGFVGSLGSSIISPAQNSISVVTGISQDVAVLSVSFYVLGFACGPLLWAPIGEAKGRRLSLLPATFCLGLFSIGTATSKSAASIFITRFFGGVFGSSPVSSVSAMLGDLWNPKARGKAAAIFNVANVGGAMLGPVIGAAIVVNPYLGWRWTEYIEAILVFAVFAICWFWLPELYAPVLLSRKALRLRKSTGNNNFHHPHEDIKLDARSIISQHFARPLRMLCTEPIVASIAFYGSFVYSMLYLTLEVFPIVFEQHRKYDLLTSTYPFLGSFAGVLCGAVLSMANEPRYNRIADSKGGVPVPEARLMFMVVGGVLYVVGLFWFGWTSSPQFSWMLPTVAAAFVGAGINIIMQQCTNYFVDTYGLYAASAVSAYTILRSTLAAALSHVARPMFDALGVGPAMSILGGIACLGLPMPFVLAKYGLRLRRMSKFRALEE